MPIVLISGPMAAGKTSVAQHLIDTHGFRHLKSSGYLRTVARSRGIHSPSRLDLQQIGDSLDLETDHRWLLDAISEELHQAPEQPWLIDSVRKQRQILLLKERYGRRVVHIHFTATEDVRRTRYLDRSMTLGLGHSLAEYELASSHPNEVSSRSLGSIADLVIDLTDLSPKEAAEALLAPVMEIAQ